MVLHTNYNNIKMASIYFHISISVTGSVKCAITVPNEWEDDERKSSTSFIPYYLRNNAIDNQVYKQYLPRISLTNIDDFNTKRFEVNYDNLNNYYIEEEESYFDNENYIEYNNSETDYLDNDNSSEYELEFVLDPV